MSDDLAERLHAEAARLRLKADGYEAAAKLIEEEAQPRKAKKAGGKKGPRPTGGRPAGETQAKVAAYLKTHPKATGAEVTRALGLKGTRAYHYLAVLRKSA